MNAPRCRCGLEKTVAPKGANQAWICRPCLRAKLRERSRAPIGVEPVSCEGAGDRLQRFLDERWEEALPRILDLLEGRPRDEDGRRSNGDSSRFAKGAA